MYAPTTPPAATGLRGVKVYKVVGFPHANTSQGLQNLLGGNL